VFSIMLNYICCLALFVVGTFSKYNNSGVNSKFILFPFGTGVAGSTTYFPFAIKGSNVCQPGFFANLGYTFTCSADGNYVTIKTYGSTSCTGSASTTVINSTFYGYDTTISPYNTYPGAFNCSGTDDYALINFEASNAICTSGTGYISLYAAINKCLRVPNILNGAIQNYSNLNIWCYNQNAEFQYYSINDTSCANTIENYYTASETCGYMFAFGGTTDIYGYLANCTQYSLPTNVPSNAPTNLPTNKPTHTPTSLPTASDANLIAYGMGLMIGVIITILNN